MKIRSISIFLGLVLFIVNAAPAGENMKTLFSIGAADNDSRELALGPGGWEDFDGDAFYVVGSSDPSRHWPYVHPGPSDAWAGSREHGYTIVFQAEKIPVSGVCRFTVDLVDTHHSGPPEIELDINGTALAFTLPKGASDSSLMGFPEKGREYRFSAAVPVDVLSEGVNSITITSRSGSWCVYDCVTFEAPPEMALGTVPETIVRDITTPPLLVGDEGNYRQVLRISLFNTVRGRNVSVSFNGRDSRDLDLALGEQEVETDVPAVEKETELTVALAVEGRKVAEKTVTLKPVRHWTVYFLPHSHVDIGYTHLQAEVMHRQWDNYREAIDLAKKTAAYPEGSRFRWNAEVLWPVDGLLRDAPDDLKQDFIAAAKNGQIGIDALYGSMLTGLARPEELYEFTSFARKLRADYGFAVESAMITDVPGYVWGMVPVLAQSGIRYFNPGPNHMPMLPHQGDRIGYTSEEWGDKPFWWVSQSGKDRVLVWIPTHGYSWFHSWILGNVKKAGAGPILGYIDELESSGFPYDMVQLRYTIGADNGPPDPDLPEFVRDWNTRYAWPKMIIGTTAEMFGEFERKYGDSLPEYRGDFTPYWEDGAASTAKATALNRTAAEQLVQARTLWAMTDPVNCPDLDFDEAWRNVILYTEHTWGAHNSISEPESEFVKGQWNVKRSFAETAAEMADDLTARAFADAVSAEQAGAIDVYNTSSWTRSGLVTLPQSPVRERQCVIDESGKVLLSQIDSRGQLVFFAADVPPFSAKRFFVKNGTAPSKSGVSVEGNVLSNGILTVGIDPETGGIGSITRNGIEQDFADNDPLNGYYYLPGKDPKDAVPSGETTLSVVENGPLFVTIEAVSKAPGAYSVTRRYRIIDSLDYLEISNTVDKQPVKDKESVHFAFPFNVPDGEVRYDIAWGVVRPDEDQLPGGNRNFFSVQRWADVSAKKDGITLATLDAPLIELAGMNAEEWNLEAHRPWLKQVPETQTVYSYVMNNYWHTNYKAYQDGPVNFRYALRPHKAFDSAGAKRFGIEMSQPFVAVPVQDSSAPAKLPFDIDCGDTIIVSSVTALDKGNAFMLRLFNSGEKSGSFACPKGCKAWIGTPDGVKKSEMGKLLKMNGFEVATVILEP